MIKRRRKWWSSVERGRGGHGGIERVGGEETEWKEMIEEKGKEEREAVKVERGPAQGGGKRVKT